MKFSLREKLMLCLLIWAVGVYLFYNYAYTPVNRAASDWMEKNSLAREQVEAARKIDQEMKGMQDRQQSYQERYAALAQQLPASEYLPEMVAFVDKTAADAGMTLKLFNHQKVDAVKANPEGNTVDMPAAGVKSLDCTLSGSGTYYQLVTFMKSLEQAPRIYNMNNIVLSAAQRQIHTIAVPTAAGEAPPAPIAELKGSAQYDPDHILLNLTLQAYCDGKAVPGIKDIDQTVEPVSTQRDNPFTP